MTSHPRVLLALPRYRGQNHALFLGVASLAAALDRAGIDVVVFDEDVAEQAERAGDGRVSDLLKRVVDRVEPTVIGVHVNTPNYAAALSLSARLRDLSDAPMVAGGPHASVSAEVLLERHPQFDFVVGGEAEASLPVLVRAVHERVSVDEVPGLVRREPEGLRRQARAPLLRPEVWRDPDRRALLQPPDPTLREHARTTYRRNFSNTMPGFDGREVAGAYVSRGCYGRCPFCSPAAFWSDPRDGSPCRRVRPVRAVLHEMRDLRELGYGAVFFDEPTFPLATEPDWLEAFGRGMRDLDLLWGAPTRLEELVPEQLARLAAHGLRYVYFGLETPVPKLQQALDKPTDVVQALSVMHACEDFGIQCDASIFFGAPGETEETILDTLGWLDRHLPRGNAFFSLAAIWPGTPWARDYGLGPECWELDYDKEQAERFGVVWYPESARSIDRFYSNSTGTYHPAFLSPERALWIKAQIIDSGFRDRFSRCARRSSLVEEAHA